MPQIYIDSPHGKAADVAKDVRSAIERTGKWPPPEWIPRRFIRLIAVLLRKPVI